MKKQMIENIDREFDEKSKLNKKEKSKGVQNRAIEEKEIVQ